jgi:hypothetical protein
MINKENNFINSLIKNSLKEKRTSKELFSSIKTNNLKLLKELLEKGININIQNKKKKTPLIKSIEKENYDAMIILLNYNCDINLTEKNGNSALHIACKKKKINFISALLRHGSNPNLCNKLFNQTPFHIAIIEQLNQDIIILFKLFHADLFNIKDIFNKSPFDYCKNNGENYEKMVIQIFNDNTNLNNNNINNNSDFLSGNFYKEKTPKKKNHSTIQFPEKFSSSELIAKGGDFDSSKSKSIIIKSNSNNNSDNSIKEIIRSAINETVKKIKVENYYNSNFNFTNPKNKINYNKKKYNTNNKNYIETNMFNLDCVSTFLSEKNKNKYKKKENNKKFKKEIYPLDLINQVNTTPNNSNIFSELKLKTQSENLNEYSENKINEYIPTFETNDMEYSKSKSLILSNNNNSNKKNEIDLKNISIISHKLENSDFGNKENLNPNLIHIEEIDCNNNTHKNSNSNNYILSKNNFSSSNIESNNNTGNNINKEIKMLNLNPNYSNLYTSNSTGRETQRNFSFINNNNLNDINNNNNKLNINIPNNNNNKLINNNINFKINNTQNNIENNYSSLFTSNQINGNITYNSFNTPLYNIHKKKSSLLTEYSYNNKEENNNLNDSIENTSSKKKISNLRNWLISCNLISYLNLLINNNIYDIDKYINNIKKGNLEVNYKDVENIGIRKPGHIFRFLLKLNIDSEKIDFKIINFLNNICNKNNNIEITENNINCSCCNINENYYSNYKDIYSFLESKKISYLKENFIHNGFEDLDFLLLQIFSQFNFDNESLIEYLHIYNQNDRNKVLNIFILEKKKICDELNIPFDENINLLLSVEREELGKCKLCNIF